MEVNSDRTGSGLLQSLGDLASYLILQRSDFLFELVSNILNVVCQVKSSILPPGSKYKRFYLLRRSGKKWFFLSPRLELEYQSARLRRLEDLCGELKSQGELVAKGSVKSSVAHV